MSDTTVKRHDQSHDAIDFLSGLFLVGLDVPVGLAA